MGTVLSQVQGGTEVVVVYYSKTLSPREELLHYQKGTPSNSHGVQALSTMSVGEPSGYEQIMHH